MKLAYNILIVDDVSDNIKVAMNILQEKNQHTPLCQRIAGNRTGGANY